MFRRFALALVLAVLVGSTLIAQTPTSITQMTLVSSSRFTTRLQYLMGQIAVGVLAEPHDGSAATPIPYDANCHNLRAYYAKAVIGSPAQQAQAAAVLVSGANFAGGVIVGTVITVDGQADSSAPDTSITVALRNLWNAFAGCDTGTGN